MRPAAGGLHLFRQVTRTCDLIDSFAERSLQSRLGFRHLAPCQGMGTIKAANTAFGEEDVAGDRGARGENAFVFEGK